MQNMGRQAHCKGHYMEEYVMTCTQSTMVDDFVFRMMQRDLKLQALILGIIGQ